MSIKSSETFSLDLRGVACPINFIRCRLALEDLSLQDSLEVYLDKGEPQETVIVGLKNEGHKVVLVETNSTWVKIMVLCGSR